METDNTPRNGHYASLSILNPSPKIQNGHSLLHDLVLSRGRSSDLAIEFLNKDKSRSRLTYDELRFETAKLSYILKSVLSSKCFLPKKQVVIPILLPQSIELYIAWLAVLKAGGGVCPLSLDAPQERIKFILEDVSADIVITSPEFADKFKGLNQTVILVPPDDSYVWNMDLTSDISNEADRQDTAYVMYTSGSTGLPKGVVVSHSAVTQSLLAHDDLIPSFRRFLQFASPTFDVSVFEIFFPLFRGASLVGCERGTMLNDLPWALNELHIDAAELTPTVAGQLLCRRSAAPLLRVLLTIGEMLTRHVIDEFGTSTNKDGILYGMYGPTEAAIHCTATNKVVNGSRTGNIGTPFDTVSVFIIPLNSSAISPENALNIQPVGHVGELALGGHQIADSYLNRDFENEVAFLDIKPHGRMYRTGDKARLLPNGQLEILGRISTGQVKLRGQRIELSEIEHVLLKVPGTQKAIVSVVDGIVVAFLSVEKGSTNVDKIVAICRNWLPKYMIPGDFIFIDKLPRLTSGKVDKKALEAQYIQKKEFHQFKVQHFNDETEKRISQCVEESIGFSVSSLESLSASGLDSLKSIGLVTRLRKNGINIDVVGILEADSIQGIWSLARDLEGHNMPRPEQKEPNSEWNSVVKAAYFSIQSLGLLSEVENIIPCSPIQTAMLSVTAQSKDHYFNQIELDFGSKISVANVKDSIRTVTLTNEILRSGFIESNQPNNPYAQVTWKTFSSDRFHEGLKHGSLNLLYPFHVDLRQVDGRCKATFHIHHALYDGWSWDHVYNDLNNSLAGKVLESRPSYRLFTGFHMNSITPDDKEAATGYWRNHLGGVKPSHFPNLQNTTNVSAKYGVMDRFLNMTMHDIDASVKKLRTSRQTIFQAAFAYLLSSYIGDSDVIFGSVFSGRTVPVDGIEDIVGPCVTTVPLRVDIRKVQSAGDLIGLFNNLNRKSLKHGFLPLNQIKKVSGVDPSTLLFDSLFVWQESFKREESDSKLVRELNTRDFLEFNITLEVSPRRESVYVRVNFQESVVPRNQVDLFLAQLEEIASLFVRKSEVPLTEVNSLLPSSLLSVENHCYSKVEKPLSLFSEVETFAKLDPTRVALEFTDHFDPGHGTIKTTTLTYAELDTRSNQLTNCLYSRGLGQGDLVAIFLEKSINLYVCILAIMKAGAGYVPITAQTPIERTKAIIKSAGCQICVTSSDLSSGLEDSSGIGTLEIDLLPFHLFNVAAKKGSVDASSIAYAVFTSGTTGLPKGVLITHHNILSNIAVLSKHYPYFPESRLLQATSFAFDGQSMNHLFSLMLL